MLGLLLLGIAHLAKAYGITAMDQSQAGYQSVLSQLVGAVYGRGWFYYVTIGSVLAVLCLSANTRFVGLSPPVPPGRRRRVPAARLRRCRAAAGLFRRRRCS